MRRVGPCIRVLSFLLFPCSTLVAQTVTGRVADSTGSALAHANVSVAGLSTQTGDNGRYTIVSVPSGSQVVRVRLIGYVAAERAVTLAPGATQTADFTLQTQPISIAGIDVVVGSRARHSAAEELAVPVDVFTSDDLAQQGSNETSQILQTLSPSVNFPRQSVTDATDIVRPFTLRGLSPDHTLVLLNGWRRHQMALVNTFAYGMGAGSSGVDLNTVPSSALDRVEVLRDGAAAQYGSDAIAGVVNLVLREGSFAPFVNGEAGRYVVGTYPDDGNTVDVSGGVGLGAGRGSLSLFAEVLDRRATNRAWADPYDDGGTGQFDSVNAEGQVTQKNSPVPQPNHHWGDGLERDIMTMVNFRLPLNERRNSELFAFGGYSQRQGSGNGYRRYATSARNWPQIYPLGFLPEFHPDVTDYSLAGGYRASRGGWQLEIGGAFGHNDFEYNLRNTLNTSLGPSTTVATAPGDDGVLGDDPTTVGVDESLDDPGIPNQTSFFAGRMTRNEISTGINATHSLNLGLRAPANLALGVAYRWEQFRIEPGELASYIDGGHLASDSSDATGGSQVFAGFSPSDSVTADRSNVAAYADLEADLTAHLLGDVAARFEHYSDFGSLVTGKLALRYQATPQLTLRAAGSTGFRAPGLGQINFSKVVTNVIAGAPVQVGVYPVDHPASLALGSRPLKEETSVNLSGGLAWSPRSNVSFTVDYFHITINDRILLGATFDDDTTLAILAGIGRSDIGAVQYFTNGLDTRTQGVDANGNWRVAAAGGSLDLTAAVNYTKNEITHVDPLPAPFAGDTVAPGHETGIIDSVTYIAITAERPDWRGSLTAQWSRGPVRLLGRASYYGVFSSAQPGYCDNCRDDYNPRWLLDAELGYRVGPATLSLGARNLLDTYPQHPNSPRLVDPNDPSAGTITDYNNNYGVFPWAAASPFGYNGRYVYARVSVPFSSR